MTHPAALAAWLQVGFIVSIALAALLLFLHVRLRREAYLRYWAYSWICLGFHEATVAVFLQHRTQGGESAITSTLVAAGAVAAYLQVSFTVVAGMSLSRNVTPRILQVAVFVVPLLAATVGILHVAEANDQTGLIEQALTFLIVPREYMNAAATVFFAILFSRIPRARDTFGRTCTLAFCVLLAIHRVGFAAAASGLPFYPAIDSYSVSVLGIVLPLGLTLGLAFTAIEDAYAAASQTDLVWEASLDGMALSDATGKIVRVNTAFCELIGRDRHDLEGRAIASVVAEPDAARFAREYAEGIRNGGFGERSEGPVTLWDGRRVSLQRSQALVRGLAGGPGVLTVLRDVSAQVAIEQALVASEERMRLAADSTYEAIFDWRLDPDEVYVSPRMYRMLGYDPGEVQPTYQIWLDLQHPDARACVERAMAQVATRDGPVEVEHRMRTKAGEWLWVLTRARAVERFSSGEPRRIVGTITDVAERKAAESERERLRQELHHAQRLDGIGRLATGVAHEFNNLLTVILGYSHSALTDLQSSDVVAASLEEIRRAGERASSLTRALLTFGRKQPATPRVIDLNEVLAESQRMLSRLIGEHVAIESCFDRGLPRVVADPGEIHQIMVNLALNARDAMPRGGTLRIETLTETTGRAALIISDTGHGMDPGTKARIFEPFFTTKDSGKGTGLGLSVVYGILKGAGANVRVDSALGRGTTFTMSFPAAPPAGRQEDGPASRTAAASSHVSAL